MALSDFIFQQKNFFNPFDLESSFNNNAMVDQTS